MSMKRAAMWRYLRLLIMTAELHDGPLRDHFMESMDFFWHEMSDEEMEFVREISAKLAADRQGETK